MRYLPLLLVCGSLGALPGVELHVAPRGDDAWSGRLPEPAADRSDGPLATLFAARTASRRLRHAGQPVTVFLHGGCYRLDRTFTLDAEDSGTADAPAVWQAWRDEQPVLHGGRPITGWKPHRDGILTADVGAQGFTGIRFRQLVMDGRRQPLAQYPNADGQDPWAHVDGVPVPMFQEVPGESLRTLVCKAGDVRSWADPGEGEVFIFPRFNWWNDIARIAAWDPATRTITLGQDASYAMRSGDRYHVRGLREELDAPGEWYLDQATWTLSFKPPGDIATADIYAPVIRTIIRIGTGATGIRLIGLTLAGCAGTAVELDGTRDCLVAACTIHEAGDYDGSGVSVQGGSGNGVVGCDIHDIGRHGIALSGGDRTTLAPADNHAVNNHLHHVGVEYKQGVGIHLTGCGNRAARNLIHDTPRMGILFHGNNQIIEGNHIHHVNLETEDTGAIYTGGRDWLGSRGSVIRHNFIHDSLGFGRDQQGRWSSPFLAWGIYLDDNTGGVDVVGNILVRCSQAGLHLHNARDNHIENNIIADNGVHQVECNGWTVNTPLWREHLPAMIRGYESVLGQPAWRAMRNMDIHPTRAPRPDGTIMAGNRFERNVVAYRGNGADGFHFRNLPLEGHVSDHNLVWHGGQPFATGYRQVVRETGGNLVANPGFEEEGPDRPPRGWSWQEPPVGLTAERVEEAGMTGRGCLRLTMPPTGAGIRKAPFVSADAPALPGTGFRLTARMKADRAGMLIHLSAQSYAAQAYYWAREQACPVGQEWRTFELVFTMPAPGTSGFHERMSGLRIRIDAMDREAGVLWIDDVALHQADVLDEWSSWQALGGDRHSLAADPLFVALERDDWRLKADSPAFQLGFTPIPFERIGPYQDPLRASWPIREADGAR